MLDWFAHKLYVLTNAIGWMFIIFVAAMAMLVMICGLIAFAVPMVAFTLELSKEIAINLLYKV